MNIEEIVKNNKKYKDFTVLENPEPLNEFIKEDTDLIQFYSAEPIRPSVNEYEIVGFVGKAGFINKELFSLDGDTYNPKTLILAYHWFVIDNKKCLDILVGNDW